MTLDDLIKIADEAYSSHADMSAGLITAYHENPDGEHGDGLARFIAVELNETFDPDATTLEQLSEANRVMTVAMNQLEFVANAFAGKASVED